MRVQRVEHGAGGVNALALDAGRARLVVGDDAGVIRIWNLTDTEEPLRDVEPPFTTIDALAWLPDRNGFVAAGLAQIGAWRLDDGSALGTWPQMEGVPQSVCVVDNTRALVACDDSKVRLIDFSSGAVVAQAPAGERNTGIAPHPDGKRYAICACDQGGSAVRWYACEGDELRVLDRPKLERNVDYLTAPAIEGNGKLLMVADHRLSIYDIATSKRVAGYDAGGKKTRIRLGDGLLVETFWTQCVTLGSSALACASPEGPVLVYDGVGEKLELRRELEQPATALTADRDVLAAASMDWTLVIWWPQPKR